LYTAAQTNTTLKALLSSLQLANVEVLNDKQTQLIDEFLTSLSLSTHPESISLLGSLQSLLKKTKLNSNNFQPALATGSLAYLSEAKTLLPILERELSKCSKVECRLTFMDAIRNSKQIHTLLTDHLNSNCSDCGCWSVLKAMSDLSCPLEFDFKQYELIFKIYESSSVTSERRLEALHVLFQRYSDYLVENTGDLEKSLELVISASNKEFSKYASKYILAKMSDNQLLK
jgi:hypothetical protein